MLEDICYGKIQETGVSSVQTMAEFQRPSLCLPEVMLSLRFCKLWLCLLKSSSGLFNSYDTWAVEEGKHNSKHKSKYLPYALRHYGEYKQKLQAKSKFSSCL